MDAEKYTVCGVPGCNARLYEKIELFYDEHNNCLNEEDLKNRCRISGNLTRPDCHFYKLAYSNKPKENPPDYEPVT